MLVLEEDTSSYRPNLILLAAATTESAASRDDSGLRCAARRADRSVATGSGGEAPEIPKRCSWSGVTLSWTGVRFGPFARFADLGWGVRCR